MKKKLLSGILIATIALGTCGCVKGEEIPKENYTQYTILLNYGSCFIYTFKDEKTGVWYISTPEGITPRLNADGTLYTEGE